MMFYVQIQEIFLETTMINSSAVTGFNDSFLDF